MKNLVSLSLLAAFLASGCGSDAVTPVTSTQQGLREFIIIPNQGLGTLTVKDINLVNGTSSLVSSSVSSGGATPVNVKTCPGRGLFFVANSGDQNVASFSIDANGAIANLGTVPAPSSVGFLAVHPSGKFVYAAGRNDLRVYAVQANGTLSQVGGAITLGANIPGTSEGAFSNNGQALHIGENGRIETFTVNPNTGAVSGPLVTALANGGDRVFDLSVNPDQTVLEAVVRPGVGVDGQVRGYPLSAGALGAPSVLTLAGTDSIGCDFARNGQFFLGTTGFPPSVRGYNVAASGALSEFANSPVSNGNSSSLTALDPSNQFLFSLGGSTLDTRGRLQDGTIASGVTSDSNGINSSLRFDFFQYTFTI